MYKLCFTVQSHFLPSEAVQDVKLQSYWGSLDISPKHPRLLLVAPLSLRNLRRKQKKRRWNLESIPAPKRSLGLIVLKKLYRLGSPQFNNFFFGLKTANMRQSFFFSVSIHHLTGTKRGERKRVKSPIIKIRSGIKCGRDSLSDATRKDLDCIGFKHLVLSYSSQCNNII